MLIDKFVVFAVRSDPEPYNSIRSGNAQSPISESDTYRPETVYLFEVQRRMTRVAIKEIEVGVRQLLDRWWKSGVALPKAG